MTGLSASGVARARVRLRHELLLVLVALVVLAAPGAAEAQEYPSGGNGPSGITVGPDGRLWYALEGNPGSPDSKIGAIDPTTGAVQTYETGRLGPSDITVGPDGNLWFTVFDGAPGGVPATFASSIGRITPAGVVTIFDLLLGPLSTGPSDITAGPPGDPHLYFTRFAPSAIAANAVGAIGRVNRTDPNAPFVEPNFIPLPNPPFPAGSEPSGILWSDGALWFTADNLPFGGSWIGRVPTSGGTPTVTALASPTAGPSGIEVLPGENALIFAQNNINRIGRIQTGGGAPADLPGATRFGPASIALGSDGAVWFTEFNDLSRESGIGRMTTSGTYTQWAERPVGSHPDGITAGPDGALWVTERGTPGLPVGNKIIRIDPTQPPPGGGSQAGPPPNIGSSLIPPSLKKKKACKVPKLRGLSVNKAKKKLRRAKCKYRFRGKGRVVRSKPKAGKRTTKRVLVTAKAKPKATKSGKGARR